MKRFLLMSSLMLLCIQNSFCTENDSNVYKYLILRSKIVGYSSRIVQDHSYILVTDTNRIKHKGYLEILSDTTFRIWSKKGDTVASMHLNELITVKVATEFEKFIGWYYMIGTPAFNLALGIEIADLANLDKNETLTLGATLTTVSTLIFILGNEIRKGQRINRRTHKFIIHYAKGYKLRKKHINKLYPIKKT